MPHRCSFYFQCISLVFCMFIECTKYTYEMVYVFKGPSVQVDCFCTVDFSWTRSSSALSAVVPFILLHQLTTSSTTWKFDSNLQSMNMSFSLQSSDIVNCNLALNKIAKVVSPCCSPFPTAAVRDRLKGSIFEVQLQQQLPRVLVYYRSTPRSMH